MRSFYQDRLGTNIGKPQKQTVFSGYPHVATSEERRQGKDKEEEDGAVYTPVPLPDVDPETGSPPLMMYVMPHFVGNHPASWRRQFYGDLAHGVKIFDLFELVTSISVRHFRK
jgi:hypothetical protein|eukprot:COSAG06_NODE_2364_length_7003_cov_3.258980_10_plen_113_part_00